MYRRGKLWLQVIQHWDKDCRQRGGKKKKLPKLHTHHIFSESEWMTWHLSINTSVMLPHFFPNPPLVMKVSTAESRVLRNRCRNAGGLPRTSGSSPSHTRKMGPHPIPNQSLQGHAKTTTNLIIKITTQWRFSLPGNELFYYLKRKIHWWACIAKERVIN